MVLKSALATAFCTGLLILGSPAMADEYGAGEFLGMDLPKALLSPKRLGPETEFAPFPIEARTDRKQVKTERVVVPEVAERAVEPEIAARPKVAERKARVVQGRVEKPRGTARAKLARRNPLDAQARDTRIQTWPCRSGAICGWQRQPEAE
ncbi:MAG: hypothetical protein C0480_23400 [Bradyrhizobium sp.]|jgi:hypothetical protein|nr:hypothetical protein [Bradyrhizobium sp.]